MKKAINNHNTNTNATHIELERPINDQNIHLEGDVISCLYTIYYIIL